MHKHKTHVTHDKKTMTRRPAEEVLAALLRERFTSAERPVVIAIGGPGGTGKSTFCHALAKQLFDSAILTLDDYKTSRESRAGQNLFGAHPDANKMELIRTHLEAVRRGESFDQPVYNAVTGDADATQLFTPARFTILDGEISTYRQFRDLVDFAIFLDSDWRTQLATRVTRDIEERQYSREKAIATFLQSNLREFEKFGAESKAWSDVHLYRHDDDRLAIESIAEELYPSFAQLIDDGSHDVGLRGLIVPVATPFDENNTIDDVALIRHLEWLAERGVRRLMINGTTGEFFSLLPTERKHVLALARRYFPGVVMAQVGADSLVQTLEAARWAADCGADAVIALPPYYFANAPGDGVVEYFNAIADAVDVPFMIYNFAQHTGNKIAPGQLQRIRHFGIKDSDSDLSLLSATSHYFMGGDSKIFNAWQAGAVGFVSARANCLPELFVAMERAMETNDRAKGETLHAQILTVCKQLTGANQIAKIKWMLAQMLDGYPAAVRLPLLPTTAEMQAELAALVG